MTEMDKDMRWRHNWRGARMAVFRMDSCGINWLRKDVRGPEYITRLGVYSEGVELITGLCDIPVICHGVGDVQDAFAENWR